MHTCLVQIWPSLATPIDCCTDQFGHDLSFPSFYIAFTITVHLLRRAWFDCFECKWMRSRKVIIDVASFWRVHTLFRTANLRVKSPPCGSWILRYEKYPVTRQCGMASKCNCGEPQARKSSQCWCTKNWGFFACWSEKNWGFFRGSDLAARPVTSLALFCSIPTMFLIKLNCLVSTIHAHFACAWSYMVYTYDGITGLIKSLTVQC